MEYRVRNIEKDVSVACEIGFVEVPGSYKTIGVFRVSGEYKDGSAGKTDAAHLSGMMAYAVARYWRHKHWILDLSDLKYEWGNDVIIFLEYWDDFDSLSVATVFGSKCVKGVASLGGRTPDELLSAENHFDKFEDASKYLMKIIENA